MSWCLRFLLIQELFYLGICAFYAVSALTLCLFSLPPVAAHLLPPLRHPQGKPPLPHSPHTLFQLAILHSD